MTRSIRHWMHTGTDCNGRRVPTDDSKAVLVCVRTIIHMAACGSGCALWRVGRPADQEQQQDHEHLHAPFTTRTPARAGLSTLVKFCCTLWTTPGQNPGQGIAHFLHMHSIASPRSSQQHGCRALSRGFTRSWRRSREVGSDPARDVYHTVYATYFLPAY